jgi:hypothetical protein
MSSISLKAKAWFRRIQKEFKGENYWKWLLASYSKKRLSQVMLKTGDLILFKARRPFEEDEADPNLTQVAMVVQNPSNRLREVYELSPSENTFVLEAELGPDNRQQIRLVPLSEVLKFYQNLYGRDCLYVYRELELPDRSSDEQTFPELENWLLSIRGKHYSKEKEALLNSILQISGTEKDSHLFSLHLITATYWEMGLIKKDELVEYLNRDFVKQFRLSWEMSQIRLLRGAALRFANRLILG